MALSDIGHDGVLRCAINTGNRALVQTADDGTLQGVSPALARRLADEIGARFEPVIYDGAGKVFADAGGENWDVGFLAIDPQRAERVTFTRPYHGIEATFAVWASSGIDRVEGWDQPGRRIVCSVGSAYELFLTSETNQAELLKGGTPGESFERFRAGEGNMVAGIRESLQRNFGDDSTFRILEGRLTAVEQAMVLPHPLDPRIGDLDAFIGRAIEDGFVANML